MREDADLHHIFHKEPGFRPITFRQWLYDVRRSKSFAYWYKSDPIPALWFYARFTTAHMLPKRVKTLIKKLIGWE